MKIAPILPTWFLRRTAPWLLAIATLLAQAAPVDAPELVSCPADTCTKSM
jgi:hypothetical protein